MRRLFPVTDQTAGPATGVGPTGRAVGPTPRPTAGRDPGPKPVSSPRSAPTGTGSGSGSESEPGSGFGFDSGSDSGSGAGSGHGSGPGPGPEPDTTDREWSLAELAAAYAYPAPDGRRQTWLRANMVSTLDGAAQHDGRSQPISSAADMRVFGTLRALADVVIAGAETVRQEGYRPARARAEFAEARRAAGQGPVPAVAVVSASLELDFSLPLFTAPAVPTLILTGAAVAPDRIAAAERAGARVVTAGDGIGVDPARALRELAGLGHTRLLTEGGPRLLGQFVTAGVLDELCLTVSPMLTAGDAQRIAGGPSVEVPRRFALVSLLEEEGFLFSRYRRD